MAARVRAAKPLLPIRHLPVRLREATSATAVPRNFVLPPMQLISGAQVQPHNALRFQQEAHLQLLLLTETVVPARAAKPLSLIRLLPVPSQGISFIAQAVQHKYAPRQDYQATCGIQVQPHNVLQPPQEIIQ